MSTARNPKIMESKFGKNNAPKSEAPPLPSDVILMFLVLVSNAVSASKRWEDESSLPLQLDVSFPKHPLLIIGGCNFSRSHERAKMLSEGQEIISIRQAAYLMTGTVK